MAVDDEVHGIALVALGEDSRTCRVFDLVSDLRNVGEIFPGNALEEVHIFEKQDFLDCTDHFD